MNRILLIAPTFFGYEKNIIEAIVSRGYDVDFIPDRIFNSVFMKAFTRLNRSHVAQFSERFFIKYLNYYGRTNYVIVFVVVGEGISTSLLKKIRSMYPASKFIFYNWDSFRNRRNLEANLRYFDYAYTFDPLDASQYGLTFRPLFYLKHFVPSPTNDYRFDVSFIGTAHSDRYFIISEFKKRLPKHINTYWYLYLQANWVFWLYKMTNNGMKNAVINEFQFKPLPIDHVRKIFNDSLSILDIEHPKQTGLTIRTLEALGAEKKLITTNFAVKNYDFYDPNNIHVIDRRVANPVPQDFFTTPYKKINPALYRKYSIEGWLDDILPDIQ